MKRGIKIILNYVAQHWRGLHGIIWSTLVNGVLAIVFAQLLVVSVGVPFGLTSSDVGFWLLLAVLAAVVIWSLVGIHRSAWRTILDPKSSIPLRAASIAALVLVVLALVFIFYDAYMLFRP